MTDLEPTPILDDQGRDWRHGLAARAGVLGALGLVVVAGIGAIALSNRADDDPAPDPDPAPDEDSTDEDSADEVVYVDIEPGGPFDGLESVGLPVVASPDVGLVDGQQVEVVGTGFQPGAQVGMVQCWFPEGGGSQEDCDLGTLVWGNADEQGAVHLTINVNRFIGTADGVEDCALGGITEGCNLGMGDASDYDQSGSARIFFDPEVEGEQPPRITVEPSTGLHDGDRLEISGTGFVPGESVLLTQCSIGGHNGLVGCYGENPTAEIGADENGEFSVAMNAVRVVRTANGESDCFSNVYGCNVVATAARSANPVAIVYDGAALAPRDPEFTLSPSEGLVDGAVIEMGGFFLPVDGPLIISQCVDQGPEGITCLPAGDAAVVGGEFTTTVTVQQLIENAAGEVVDCSTPRRNCYLTVGEPDATDIRVPLRFGSTAG